MIRDIEAARDALADSLWWMKGYAAAQTDPSSMGAIEARDMENKIGDVRRFLNEIGHATIRRMGEETAIVLSFSEFERLVDAVRVPRLAETNIAIQTIENVLAEYRAEEKRHREVRRNPNIPF